jgi:hypothetical protein
MQFALCGCRERTRGAFSLLLLSGQRRLPEPRLPALDADAPGVQLGAPFQSLSMLLIIFMTDSAILAADIAFQRHPVVFHRRLDSVGWDACMIDFGVPARLR